LAGIATCEPFLPPPGSSHPLYFRGYFLFQRSTA
jgi:hypothetical protein